MYDTYRKLMARASKTQMECTSESMRERKLWGTAEYGHIYKREGVGKSYIAYTRKYKKVGGVVVKGVTDKYLAD